MAVDTPEPRDMEWLDKGVLGIRWNDGHKSVYPVRYLRQHCPCAACVDEWTGQRRLKDEDVPLLIILEDIQAVGRYAIQFKWSDGHDTGIYAFSLLRNLCQCEACQPVKPVEPRSRRLM